MSFEDYHERTRVALNCQAWARSGGRRYGELAHARASQRSAEARDRAIRAFARDHRCSHAEAEATLFGED